MSAPATTTPRETYSTAVRDLNNLQTNFQIIQQIKASGGRINEYSIPEFAAFVEKLGHQVDDLDSLNVIHVTGTKGKGSTCAFVSSILRQIAVRGSDGSSRPLKIGLFTSPHLIEVRERIQINGEPISQEAFAKYFYQTYNGLKAEDPPLRKVTPESPDMPMYFRFLTLMAYHTFLMEKVDVAIMEVGVGGQYDSTNVIRKPVVCGIASLGIDHQNSLGSTIEEIAWHKGGIIKDNVPAFTVDQPESALEVLRKRAGERSAPLAVVHPLDTVKLGGLNLGISGEHQAVNAALAVELCRTWVKRTGIDKDIVDGLPESQGALEGWVKRGLESAHWPGRSQTFASQKFPAIAWHADGAHTVESMAACGKWFAAQARPETPCVLLFNAAHDRSARALLETLWESIGDKCGSTFVDAVFCPNLSNRADSVNFTVQNDEELKPQKESAHIWAGLSGVQETRTFGTINDAVAYIESTYGSKGRANVLATGSLHLVGGVLDAAKGST
ncbi:FolC bifunctional protein [Martensiomyces pterosporus]|nr:FolC bifunctional protein [Martensiomyces pterosporus]